MYFTFFFSSVVGKREKEEYMDLLTSALKFSIFSELIILNLKRSGGKWLSFQK